MFLIPYVLPERPQSGTIFLHYSPSKVCFDSADLGLSSGSSLVTTLMSWVLKAWSIEPAWKPSKQNPPTGLLAVSLAERSLSSRMSPPSTTPKISAPSNSWEETQVQHHSIFNCLIGYLVGREVIKHTKNPDKARIHQRIRRKINTSCTSLQLN